MAQELFLGGAARELLEVRGNIRFARNRELLLKFGT
jgi:hypothetical protein